MSNPNRHHERLFTGIGAELLISSEGDQKGNQKLSLLNSYICKLLETSESGRSAAW